MISRREILRSTLEIKVAKMGGDKNSKFFHAATMQRKDRNRIEKLKDADGEWKKGQQEVTKVILDHFQAIFTSSDPKEIMEYTRVIPKKVDDWANEDLNRAISEEEIRRAIFSLCSLKALEEISSMVFSFKIIRML